MAVWDALVAPVVPPKGKRGERHRMEPRKKKPPRARLACEALVVIHNPWGLSPGQANTLEALHRGGTQTTAAEAMGLNRKTINMHMQRAREKMKVHSAQQAIRLWAHFRLFGDPVAQKEKANYALICALAVRPRVMRRA